MNFRKLLEIIATTFAGAVEILDKSSAIIKHVDKYRFQSCVEECQKRFPDTEVIPNRDEETILVITPGLFNINDEQA